MKRGVGQCAMRRVCIGNINERLNVGVRPLVFLVLAGHYSIALCLSLNALRVLAV